MAGASTTVSEDTKLERHDFGVGVPYMAKDNSSSIAHIKSVGRHKHDQTKCERYGLT